MKQLSLKLDDHLYEKLKNYTKDNGVSASSVLTDSLVAHLTRQKRFQASKGQFYGRGYHLIGCHINRASAGTYVEVACTLRKNKRAA